MPINFSFTNKINKRNKGSETIHYNEAYAITGPSGTFTTSYLPLNVASPDLRRITIRMAPEDTGTPLVETLTVPPVSSGYFYCNYSTGTVTVNSGLVGVCTFTATPTDTVNKTAHGFANGDLVGFSTTGSLPAAIDVGTLYYVVNGTDDTFQISLTPGGSPVSFASAGTPTSYVGSTVYATYNGPVSAYTAVDYLVPTADADLLCRVTLAEIPLEFNLTSTDTRKISITSTLHSDLTETKTLGEVISNPLYFYVEYNTGRITLNQVLANDHIFVTYYGSGSVVWASDVQECTAAYARLDVSALYTDGSSFMSGNLNMGNTTHSIINLGSGTVDGIKVSTHNHRDIIGGLSTGKGFQLYGVDSILPNTIQSSNLETKAGPDSGAVSTYNIQDTAVTHIELLSDTDSLEKVSGGVLIVGGAATETVGVNVTSGDIVSSTAEIVFKTRAGVPVDKMLLHESGGTDGNSGINVNANGDLVIYSLLDRTINFVTETTIASPKIIIDNATGNFTVTDTIVVTAGDINAAHGKLLEHGYPVFPTGCTTVFYQATAPAGWIPYVVGLNDYALRIVSSGGPHTPGSGGSYTPGSAGFIAWTQGHTHTYAHTHDYPGSPLWTATSVPDRDIYAYLADLQIGGGNNKDINWSNAQSHYHQVGFTSTANGDASSVPMNFCKWADAILASKN